MYVLALVLPLHLMVFSSMTTGPPGTAIFAAFLMKCSRMIRESHNGSFAAISCTYLGYNLTQERILVNVFQLMT